MDPMANPTLAAIVKKMQRRDGLTNEHLNSLITAAHALNIPAFRTKEGVVIRGLGNVLAIVAQAARAYEATSPGSGLGFQDAIRAAFNDSGITFTFNDPSNK